MAQEIREKYNAMPEKQVSTGIYIKSIGTKYVTLVNTWEHRLEKIPIEEFYEAHI